MTQFKRINLNLDSFDIVSYLNLFVKLLCDTNKEPLFSLQCFELSGIVVYKYNINMLL